MKQQWKNHKPLLAALATLAVLLAGVVLIWLAQVRPNVGKGRSEIITDFLRAELIHDCLLYTSQVDAVVIDNAPAKSFVEANPGLKILDTAYAQEDYAIGVAKGNTALLDAINSALELSLIHISPLPTM